MRCRKKILECAVLLLVCVAALVACQKEEGGSCKSTSNCAENLYCFNPQLTEGTCMTEAKANAACRAETVCIQDGKCTIDTSGNCLAKTDADCAQSSGCKTGGACTASGAGYCKK